MYVNIFLLEKFWGMSICGNVYVCIRILFVSIVSVYVFMGVCEYVIVYLNVFV